MTICVGVDGCKNGWIAVWRNHQGASVQVYSAFATLLAAFPADATVAVDIPIGLPDQIVGAGREAEQCVRSLLLGKSSSVFSVPSRKAVEAGMEYWERYKAKLLPYSKAYDLTKQVACETSEPPKSLSRQTFGILPKIAEVDRLLSTNTALSKRVFESHPEHAFTVLNNGRPMAHPKKMPCGESERRKFLASQGFAADFLSQSIPRGAAVDDFLDACVMQLVAERLEKGEAMSYPSPPGRDRFDLPIAIHV